MPLLHRNSLGSRFELVKHGCKTGLILDARMETTIIDDPIPSGGGLNQVFVARTGGNGGFINSRHDIVCIVIVSLLYHIM